MTGLGDNEQAPALPDHSERVSTWGLTRLVYGAAHSCEPWDVDSTDSGYDDVARVLFDEQSEMVEVLALAAGLPEDAEYAHVLEWITERAGRTVLELPPAEYRINGHPKGETYVYARDDVVFIAVCEDEVYLPKSLIRPVVAALLASESSGDGAA